MPVDSDITEKKSFSFLKFIFPLLLCLLFFVAYSTLAIVRHNHYQSFGYDLGINDQTVWRYSKFEAPINTISPLPDKSKLYEHVELVYALIAPFYWIWSTRRMLLLVEVAFVCLGGVAIYLLARRRKLSYPVSLSILFTYLAFFGVQNAIWFDVHSLSFGAAFLAWFLYFLDKRSFWGTIVFFLLSITAKENIAFITFFISLAYLHSRRDRFTLSLVIFSALYLFFIFFVYFPILLHSPYIYQNSGGLLSNLNPLDLVNTDDKVKTIFFTLFTYGYIPALAPISLIPAFADLATYFIIGNDVAGAQGLFMHYRITLAPLLSWATITTISRYRYLNTKYVAIYLIATTLITQYTLHLPLSYLTKSWFWQAPAAVKSINEMKDDYLPDTASVVAQNNIVPHISQRDKIYSLYFTIKKFPTNSPCGYPSCHWLTWYGEPEYLFVDTSSDWDIRHLLVNRAKGEI